MKFKFKLAILKKIEKIQEKQKLFELASKLKEARDFEEQEVGHERLANQTYEVTNEFEKNDSASLENASLFREHSKDRSFRFRSFKNNALREADDIRINLYKVKSKLNVLEEKEKEERRQFEVKQEKKKALLIPTNTKKLFLMLFLLPLFAFGEEKKEELPKLDTEKKTEAKAETKSEKSESFKAKDTEKKKDDDGSIADKEVSLKEREEKLAAQEKKLQEWEKDLQKREKDIQALMGKIDTILAEKKKVDTKTIKNQTTMITNMKPAGAADLLSGMNEELALEVMKNLRPNQLSTIFNAMKKPDVVRLTEILSGYRKPNAGGLEVRQKSQ